MLKHGHEWSPEENALPSPLPLTGEWLLPTLGAAVLSATSPGLENNLLTTELTDVARDIMARLKRETAPLHGELDAMVAPMLTERARYRTLVAGLRDAYAVIEPELARHALPLSRAAYDVADRTKLGWLDSDLRALCGSEPAAIRGNYTLPNASAAFGAVYVVEGATLGGQVIARQVIPALDLSPERGCRFFTGYGPDTGERWRETRDAIAAHLASAAEADAAYEMIGGARMTFALIGAVLGTRIRA